MTYSADSRSSVALASALTPVGHRARGRAAAGRRRCRSSGGRDLGGHGSRRWRSGGLSRRRRAATGDGRARVLEREETGAVWEIVVSGAGAAVALVQKLQVAGIDLEGLIGGVTDDIAM